MLVEQRAEPEEEIGLERRHDEEVLSVQPREQAVADQAVAEVRRQQAQRATEAREAERSAAAPSTRARSDRCVCTTPFGCPVVPEVKRISASSSSDPPGRGPACREAAALGFRGIDDSRSEAREAPRRLRFGRARPQRQARRGGARQRLDLERRQPRVDGHRTSAEAPDRQHVDEELRACSRSGGIRGRAAPGRAARRRRGDGGSLSGPRLVPVAPGHRLGERPGRRVKNHAQSRRSLSARSSPTALPPPDPRLYLAEPDESPADVAAITENAASPEQRTARDARPCAARAFPAGSSTCSSARSPWPSRTRR